MNRWDLVRQRIEDHLGARTSEKDRAFSSRRKALADEMGMGDSTLKSFLPAKNPRSSEPKSGTLGLGKLAKLLAKPEFQDLLREFPELGSMAPPAEVLREIQLKIEFHGFGLKPEHRTLRLPVDKEGKLQLLITKMA
jgi:hypothetical protein